MNGSNALLTAATMNRPDLIRRLLELGADPNAKSEGGHAALTYLAMMFIQAQKEDSGKLPPDPEAVRMLVSAGADCLEAMTIAVKTGIEDFAGAVVSAGGDVNLQDAEGR